MNAAATALGSASTERPSRLSILQLISSAGYYGAETMVTALSRQLNQLGVPNTLAVFQNAHRPNHDLALAAKRYGIEVVTLPCNGQIDWNVPRMLREMIATRHINVIHTHGYKAHSYASMAVRPPRILSQDSSPIPCALVATCHGLHGKKDGIAGIRQMAYEAAERKVLRGFHSVVAVSESLASYLRFARVSADRITVIANGVDVDEFASARPAADLRQRTTRRIAIGIVARLIPGKGHSELLIAAKALREKHPTLLVVIVGDGPLAAPLEKRVRELELGDHVFFAGKRDDMPRVYAALDICALPSHSEGMPMVLLEAMSAAKPVVATRVGAISSLVEHETSGLLVPPKDTTALIASLDRLLSSPSLRKACGENAQSSIRDRFCADAMARMYVSVYEEAACPR